MDGISSTGCASSRGNRHEESPLWMTRRRGRQQACLDGLDAMRYMSCVTRDGEPPWTLYGRGAESRPTRALKVPEFLREPLEAAQARLVEFEEEAQRVFEGVTCQKGRDSRKDVAELVQRLSKQDWRMDELKDRVTKLRDHGWNGRMSCGRARTRSAPRPSRSWKTPDQGGRVPGRGDPRAGGGALARAGAAREADRQGQRAQQGEEVEASVQRRRPEPCPTCARRSRRPGRRRWSA